MILINDGIEMNLRPVTKPEKKDATTLKKSCQKFMTSFPFFYFLVHLERSGTCIQNVCSMIVTLSLKSIFFHKKSENRVLIQLP